MSRAATRTGTELNVSLEPHLIDVLEPLVSILPESISLQLSTALKAPCNASPELSPTADPSSPTIAPAHKERIVSYGLLSSISSWARSAEGRDLLGGQKPPLDPHTYSMVALLAGTRTSPERKFPSHAPLVTDGQAEAGRELNDRRAVTAVLNALLSIFGSGAATWWAAEKLYWKDEWKVLLALLVAIAVATSEVVLYLIWDARRSDSSSKTASRRALTPRHTPLSGVPSRDPTHSTGEPAQPSATLIVDNQSSTDIPYMPGANDPNVQQYRTADGLRERTVGHN